MEEKDKQTMIESAKRIRDICIKNDGCNDCPFVIEDSWLHCGLAYQDYETGTEYTAPYEWNI